MQTFDYKVFLLIAFIYTLYFYFIYTPCSTTKEGYYYLWCPRKAEHQRSHCYIVLFNLKIKIPVQDCWLQTPHGNVQMPGLGQCQFDCFHMPMIT